MKRIRVASHRARNGRAHRDGALTAGRGWHPNLSWRVAASSELEPEGGRAHPGHLRPSGVGPIHGSAIDHQHTAPLQQSTAVLAGTGHVPRRGDEKRREHHTLTNCLRCNDALGERLQQKRHMKAKRFSLVSL